MIKHLSDLFYSQRSRLKRLTKETAWILFGQASALIGTLFLIRVLTEYLEPSDYGYWALGLTLSGLFTQVLFGGLGNGVCRYFSIAKEKGDVCNFLHASTALFAIPIGISLILVITLTALLTIFELSKWVNLVLALAAFSLCSSLSSAMSGIQNAARRRSVVAIHSGADAWLKVVFSLSIIEFTGASIESIALAYFFTSLVIMISQAYFLWRLIDIEPLAQYDKVIAKDWLKQIFSFSWPFSLFGVFTWFYQASDRWVLQAFSTVDDVGQYVVVYQIGFAPIALGVGLIISLLAPIFYQRAGDLSHEGRVQSVNSLILRIVTISLAVTFLGFLITLGFHERLFSILVSENYRKASIYLPWIVLAGGIFASGQILSVRFMSDCSTKKLIPLKIIPAVIGVGTNILGAVSFGLTGVVGAAVGTATLSFTLVLLSVISSSRKMAV